MRDTCFAIQLDSTKIITCNSKSAENTKTVCSNLTILFLIRIAETLLGVKIKKIQKPIIALESQSMKIVSGRTRLREMWNDLRHSWNSTNPMSTNRWLVRKSLTSSNQARYRNPCTKPRWQPSQCRARPRSSPVISNTMLWTTRPPCHRCCTEAPR